MSAVIRCLVAALACCSVLARGGKSPVKNVLPHTKTPAQSGPATTEGKSAGESFLVGLASGAVAGTTVDLILFPLDTVKTRLQATAGATLNADIFKGLFDGVAPAIAASAPCAAVFFGAYDTFKRVLTTSLPPKYTPFLHSAAAAAADLTQSIVRVPFEVVKQRLQAGVEPTTMKAISNIMSTQGLAGFYNGWGALALRDLPFDIIEFPLYEWFKTEWARRKGAALSPLEGALCGSVAGGIAAGLTTPLDVVKTRLMTQAGSGQYKGVADCIQAIMREEGMAALWSGMIPRATSIAFGGAIFFGAYETSKKILLDRLANKELNRSAGMDTLRGGSKQGLLPSDIKKRIK